MLGLTHIQSSRREKLRSIPPNALAIYLEEEVEAWHSARETDLALHEYLGLTSDEYSTYVTSPETFFTNFKP